MSTRMTIGNQPIVLDNLTHNYDFTDYVSGASITNMLSATSGIADLSGSLSNSPDHNKLGYIELDGNDQQLTWNSTYGLGDTGPETTLELGFRIPTGTSNTVWLMTTNGGSLSIDSNNTGHTFAIARDSNSKLTFRTYLGSTHFQMNSSTSTSDILNNVWYHLCVRIRVNTEADGGTVGNTRIRAHVNNVQFFTGAHQSGATSRPYRYNGANTFLVTGRDGRSGSNYYPLQVAYFRRYSNYITDVQVTQNYNHHAARFGAY